ncbi:MAG: M20 family metallopeptidase [Halobacteriota archaeon]
MTAREEVEHRANDLLAWARDHREDVESHLLGLVEMETPSDEPRVFDEFFEAFSGDLERLELETARHDGEDTGGWLEAYTPGAETAEVQLVLGHADTVWPLGTLDDRPPEVRDDVLEAPGALDMKGGLTQLVHALRALREEGLETGLPVYVLVNSDEEIGSPESRQRIEELAGRANRVFVLEPASGPEGRIKVARKAVGRFTVEIEGVEAHAGIEPEEGASATEELGNVIRRLHALTDFERGVTVNVGEVEAGMRSNVVAANALAEVDVRAPTAEAADRLESEIRALEAETSGTSLTVTGGFGRPPMEETPGNQALWRRVREIGASMDVELEPARSGGASDGNLASQHAPTVDGLGAVGDGAHKRYEYVDLDALVERVALLAACLADRPLRNREENL